MEHEDLVVISDVLLLSDGEVLTVDVGGRRYAVPLAEAAWEGRICQTGQRGTLRLGRAFAARVGLLAR